MTSLDQTTYLATLTKTLASFVIETAPIELPRSTINPTKDLILDTTGVALAASMRPIGQVIDTYLSDFPGMQATATILGRGRKASPPAAAFGNGVLANALDYDAGSHVATHVLPAALAVGEHLHRTGQELLTAFILAYEAGTRLTQVIDSGRRQNRGPTHRGWWHVGLVGPIAATLAACRLMRLDVNQTSMAIGVASCSSGGFRRNMGRMAKALHSGNAARAGIEAALLVNRGFTGDPEIIEAPLGFLSAVCAPEDRDVSAVTERLGNPFVLERAQKIKMFPACSPGHPLIIAALCLHKKASFAPDDIESVEADLHTFSLLRLLAWDEESAGFSGAFLLAASLVHGAFSLDQLTRETIRDERVQRLMKRVKHVAAAEKELVTIRLKDGKSLSVDVEPAGRFAKREDVCSKFTNCTRAALSDAQRGALQTAILELDKLSDVGDLMALTGKVESQGAVQRPSP